METIVFADPVTVTIAALNAGLAGAGQPGVTAYGRVPNPRPSKFVRVLRLGGPRRDLVTDAAMLTIEAWADNDPDSAALAQAARAVVNAMEGKVIAGTTVYTVTEFSGPGNLPDPDTTQSRHTWIVEVATRGLAT